MTNLVQTVAENKQWVFSGIGVFILGLLVSFVVYLYRKHKGFSPASRPEQEAPTASVVQKGDGAATIQQGRSESGHVINIHAPAGNVSLGNVGATGQPPPPQYDPLRRIGGGLGEQRRDYCIRFDYLPVSPLNRDWTLGYPNPRPPELSLDFRRPTELHDRDGLKIVANKVYAIDRSIPVAVPSHDRLKYNVKRESDVMIFIRVELSSNDGTFTGEKWIKIYDSKDGVIRAEPTKGAKDEWTIWVPARPLQHGWVAFDISLPEVVKETWGHEGWVYLRVRVFRLRGNLSISPITFYQS